METLQSVRFYQLSNPKTLQQKFQALNVPILGW